MLSLIIPVYRNEGSIPELLDAVAQLHRDLKGQLEAVFVVDGSPDRCFELLRDALPGRTFPSRLVLLTRNFGSFAAIRVGLEVGQGDRFAVMAADLQEPPELVLQMDSLLCAGDTDVVVGARGNRLDPLLSRIPATLFWGLYRRFVVPEIPAGGVDVFACTKVFRDTLLRLEERHSSLIAQIFWLGFRRKCITYDRRERRHGKSAWSLRKKMDYLWDSVFSFTDLPITLLIRVGALTSVAAALFGILVMILRLSGLVSSPGYAITICAIVFFGAANLLGLGVVGTYAWRAYENTKARPLAIPLSIQSFNTDKEEGR